MWRGLSTRNPIFADFWIFMPCLTSKVVTRFGKELTSLRTCCCGTVSQAAKTTSHTSSFDVIGVTFSTSVPTIDHMLSTGLRSGEFAGLVVSVRTHYSDIYFFVIFDACDVALSCVSIPLRLLNVRTTKMTVLYTPVVTYRVGPPREQGTPATPTKT